MNQHILMYLVMTFYLVMACCYFMTWLDFFIQDTKMDSSDRAFSSVILVIATILWPVIVPFAYLELLKVQKKKETKVDSFITIEIIKEGDYVNRSISN